MELVEADGLVVFNLHWAVAREEGTVIVVEGFFDCFKVHQAGFGSVVALIGVAFYDRQRWLLTERFRRIILMLDGDEPGQRASAVIAARLARYCQAGVIELAGGIQPDQLSEQSIQEILTKEGGKSKSC
jgi:DNA primase